MKLGKLMATLSLSLASLIPLQGLSDELKPFRAVYSTEIEAGVNMSAEAVRELKPLGNGEWQLSITISNMLANLQESSRFRLADQRVQPLEYRYHRKVLSKTRDALLTFDWQKGHVHNQVQEQPWKMDIPAGTQDKISYQAQLRLDLLRASENLSYPVAGGGKLQHYSFEQLGQEQITTPIGRFDAVKIRRIQNPGSDRETLIWMAPALDYQIVQLELIEKEDNKAYRLVLKSLD